LGREEGNRRAERRRVSLKACSGDTRIFWGKEPAIKKRDKKEAKGKTKRNKNRRLERTFPSGRKKRC